MTKQNWKHLVISVAVASVAALGACSKDSDEPQPPANGNVGYSAGIFIINEGPFQTGTGTITYLDRTNGSVIPNLFQVANKGALLGNVAQSMNCHPLASSLAFIAVNNANKLEVVDITTFEKVSTLPDVASPRYIEFGDNNKMYVSCWDNTVKVYTVDDTEYVGQVSAGEGPERMMRVGNTIWVLNQGGFSVDSTITVISTETDQVVHTIEVYPKPTGIQVDHQGRVWVLCAGNGWNGFPSPGDSEGHLLCIDPAGFTVIRDLVFPDAANHPEKLVIDGDGINLFYNHPMGIFRQDVMSPVLEEQPFIPHGTMFYGLGMDPEGEVLYATDPLDYVQQGRVYRYNPTTGAVIDSLVAGVIPGEFYFGRLLVNTQ